MEEATEEDDEEDIEEATEEDNEEVTEEDTEAATEATTEESGDESEEVVMLGQSDMPDNEGGSGASNGTDSGSDDIANGGKKAVTSTLILVLSMAVYSLF